MNPQGAHWASILRDLLQRRYRLTIHPCDDGSLGPIGERLARIEKCRNADEAVALALEIGFEASSAIDRPHVAAGLAAWLANDKRRTAQLERSGSLETRRDLQSYIDATWPAAGTAGRRKLSARKLVRDFMTMKGIDPDIDDSIERQLRTFAQDRLRLMRAAGDSLAGWKD